MFLSFENNIQRGIPIFLLGRYRLNHITTVETTTPIQLNLFTKPDKKKFLVIRENEER